MKSSEIRQKFLDFFESHGHTVVASSPLVPGNDPTLLFTNAGMVQFKDVFLGQDKRPYVRAASSQRCVRAGGKHNDLENVGYTARHHTFFEMLGNFSFGDYFKRNAILFAWDFLTGTLNIPREKLWVTVYAEDDEAADIWLNEVGVEPSRVVRIATTDNFWQMGDTGPCGPCSEIFYDHGPDVAGGPPGSPDADGDRYIEIWNLVFMQYNRDSAGTLHPLPKPSVDTGMGLERISAVMQHVHSNYDIDLFQSLIKAAARATGTGNLADNSLKVIADHIRACSFLITDGVIPGSEGRGYVLRRIIRRAIRHGYKLGQKQPFFHQLVEDLSQVMGQAYPELTAAKKRVAAVLLQEEERFAETLENGMQILETALSQKIKVLDGETAFRLYDTFGFPIDLTADIARERGITVDHDGFEQAMARQREQARAANKFTMQEGIEYTGSQTTFYGYDTLQHEGQVLAIYKQGSAVDFVEAGDEAVVVLDQTPFYAESGGQAGDSGELLAANGTFEVTDTQKIQAGVFGHKGLLRSGRLVVRDSVQARVNPQTRVSTANNHSATHLLHAALRKVLGMHVTQKGSLVDSNRLRFDFSHNAPMSADEIRETERLVNEQVRNNTVVEVATMPYDDAIKRGAMALFGEKYTDVVRVIGMGEFSTELCGGTHVPQVGQIGLFKIVAESGVAAGIRRVEAVTGKGAIDYVQQREAQLLEIAHALKANPQEVTQKIAQIIDNVRQTEKELARLKTKMASSQGADLAPQAHDINGVKVLAANLENADAKTLRETLDQLKDKLKTCAIVLSTVADGKVTLIAGVSADLTSKVKAGELVNFVAQQVGGKGGGRPDMAQAGGTQPEQLPRALEGVKDWVEKKNVV
ncbi:alanine--tRNA ligase [Nitrosomonas oligotropha]|uniref:Alanine--tRNA ligase n=1 Tax=Nitrosomonas oligotropha TaxID=42354 RepID=A0A1H8SDC4_9PROT|nr:alanine--tRNA ligase [Nitrosomonas oligotropha]SDX11928.1 alanyl-tRNA synthetase [Nitrosomonas oligotropha]SEO76354.1 alanyl-tRNA synthetase [Nitrosomonas oligotropha]